PSGHFLWARSLGGDQGDSGERIAIGDDGNVYSVGEFNIPQIAPTNNPADFDPGPGTYDLTSDGERDVYVSELDSSGNFVAGWRRGGPQYDAAYTLATFRDPVTLAQAVVVAGGITGTADFPTGTSLTVPSLQSFVMRLTTSPNHAPVLLTPYATVPAINEDDTA